MASRKAPGQRGAAPAKAKKKSKPVEGDAPAVVAAASVVTVEEKRAAMERLVDAHNATKGAEKDVRSQKGKYRAAFKEAMKLTGFTDRGLSNFMKDLGREPTDIDAETRETNAVHEFMGTPIGGQLGLLKDGTSIAASTEKEALRDKDVQILVAVEAQGFQAGTDAAPYDSCPFQEGSNRRKRWQKGYQEAQTKRAAAMGGDKADTPPPPAPAPTHAEPAHA